MEGVVVVYVDVECGDFGIIDVDVWGVFVVFGVDVLFGQGIDECLFDVVYVVVYIDVQLWQVQ